MILYRYEIITELRIKSDRIIKITPSFSFSMRTFFIATNFLVFLSRALNTSLMMKKQMGIIVTKTVKTIMDVMQFFTFAAILANNLEEF